MAEDNQIVNRVANSALLTFDLEEYYRPGDRVVIDIKDQLHQGLIVREKEFREYVANNDWSQFGNAFVAIQCSADAIVPTWAYMLLAIALEPHAAKVVFGTLDDLETVLYREALAGVDWDRFRGAKVVVKGCSKVAVPVAIYVEATNRLRPLASSILYGEPCSTVPLFKARR
jgi:hypothetical protein